MKNSFRLISKTEKNFEIVVEDSTGIEARGVFTILTDNPDKKYNLKYYFYNDPPLVEKNQLSSFRKLLEQFVNKNFNEIIKMKSSDYNVSINLDFLL